MQIGSVPYRHGLSCRTDAYRRHQYLLCYCYLALRIFFTSVHRTGVYICRTCRFGSYYSIAYLRNILIAAAPGYGSVVRIGGEHICIQGITVSLLQ